MRAPELDAPPISYDQYLALPETTQPREFVHGRAIVSPSPGARHQIAVVRLVRLLVDAAPPALDVIVSPFDWVLRRDPLLVRQPDVVVVPHALLRGDRLAGAPLLAAEVLSPTSRERDLVVKRGQYAEAGLAWYWLVDPDVPQVLILRSNDGVFEEHASAIGEEALDLDAPFPVRLTPAELAAD